MRNFIGNLLIGLAAIIKFLHKTLLFALIAGICIGIFMATVIAFFDLIARVAPNMSTAYADAPMQLNVFKHWYWDLIVLVIGSLTMWQGFAKAFQEDKKSSKELKNWNEYTYHGNKTEY